MTHATGAPPPPGTQLHPGAPSRKGKLTIATLPADAAALPDDERIQWLAYHNAAIDEGRDEVEAARHAWATLRLVRAQRMMGEPHDSESPTSAARIALALGVDLEGGAARTIDELAAAITAEPTSDISRWLRYNLGLQGDATADVIKRAIIARLMAREAQGRWHSILQKVQQLRERPGVLTAYHLAEIRKLLERHEANTPLGELLLQGYELSAGLTRLLVFPRGTFKHPEYGELDFDDAFFAEIKRNFDERVLGQTEPFVDLDHSHGAAAGWIKELSIEPDGLWARVEWTALGEEMLRTKQYRWFSPWFGPYKDPESGQEYQRVLRGGGLTNVPFLKVLPGIELAELTPWRRPAVEVRALLEALKTLKEASDMNDEERTLQERTGVTDPRQQYAALLEEERARGVSLSEAYTAINRRYPALSARVANRMAEASGSPFRWTEARPGTSRKDDDPGQQLAELAEKRAADKGIAFAEALEQIKREQPALVERYASTRA